MGVPGSLGLHYWFSEVVKNYPGEIKRRYIPFMEEDSVSLREYKTKSELLNATCRAFDHCGYFIPKPLWYEKVLDDYQRYQDRFVKGNYELLSPSDVEIKN